MKLDAGAYFTYVKYVPVQGGILWISPTESDGGTAIVTIKLNLKSL